jgi:protein phosphatase 1 regulatory subunit 21
VSAVLLTACGDFDWVRTGGGAVVLPPPQVLDEENLLADCTSMLKATNIAVAGTLKDIVVEVTAMSQHVTDLSAQDGATFSAVQSSVAAAVRGVSTLLDSFGNLASHFSTKLALERQLARSTDRSQSTDAVINQALTKILTNFERLVQALDENKGSLSAAAAYAVRGVPAAALAGGRNARPLEVKALQSRATRFMRTLLCDLPDSVPYAQALALVRGASSNPTARAASGGGLTRAGVGASEHQHPHSGMLSAEGASRMAGLEQEREHFKLECELLQMKLDRFEVVHSGRRSSNDDGDNATAADGGEGMAGGVQPSPAAVDSLQAADGAESARIRQHYEDRIKSLMAQLQFADSKAMSFHDECRSVAMRLEVMRHAQAKQGAEYQSVNITIAGLKADLESTKRNYEEQLSAMTEHVMTMNDQVQQKDRDIDVLMQQVKQGSKAKPGKSSNRKKKDEPQPDFPQFSRFG